MECRWGSWDSIRKPWCFGFRQQLCSVESGNVKPSGAFGWPWRNSQIHYAQNDLCVNGFHYYTALSGPRLRMRVSQTYHHMFSLMKRSLNPLRTSMHLGCTSLKSRDDTLRSIGASSQWPAGFELLVVGHPSSCIEWRCWGSCRFQPPICKSSKACISGCWTRRRKVPGTQSTMCIQNKQQSLRRLSEAIKYYRTQLISVSAVPSVEHHSLQWILPTEWSKNIGYIWIFNLFHAKIVWQCTLHCTTTPPKKI